MVSFTKMQRHLSAPPSPFFVRHVNSPGNPSNEFTNQSNSIRVPSIRSHPKQGIRLIYTFPSGGYERPVGKTTGR